ncbi:HD domain-containing protein [Rubrobacter tropicus]|uniref:HD domain-containing protein n=1 Tax=Rubrobacter tropicus TaxID=2653851 RepID=A0A6G8QCW3_9ACTN|nr:HD domain-containing protein [Rubrobacter tropicus]QIN84283.1 HD domain-containing protein [Rubrobacter tropicus]
MKSLIEEVEALVARVGTHPVWGYGHCVRVHALAEELARAEGISYDAEILRVSALLHDIGLYKAYAMREPADHAKRSAIVAQRILNDADFPPQATKTAMEAIEAHPPGTAPNPGAEATLLKDAVALDYLGVVGLSRVLAMVGTEEDVADIRAAVWHAESLRRQIPDLLILETSKDIAHRRGHETDQFMEDLRNATAGLKLL